MIKSELGKVIHVSGTPLQVAVEFEDIARSVREAFCKTFGDDIGAKLYEECVESAKMSEEERKRSINERMEAAKILDPIGVKISGEIADRLLKNLFRGYR